MGSASRNLRFRGLGWLVLVKGIVGYGGLRWFLLKAMGGKVGVRGGFD
jgi:hypothetical protein